MPGVISDQNIHDVRTRTDIVELISSYVTLKKAGRNYVGLCPFHAEKTPSFTVSPEKQIYYCFGCNAGGDAVSFLMKINGLSFGEAIRYLADKCGVRLTETYQERTKKGEREMLYVINQFAAATYGEALWSSRGKGGRDYLTSRGITDETARRFALGYAPMEWQWLYEQMKHAGFEPQRAEQAGLIIRTGKDRYYDRFRGRIIFPIYDLLGKVIALGGREVGDGTPKYMNSPESPIYIKGRVLYGLHLAREAIQAKGEVVVVEGYFDLLALWEKGITNVVATLGTALTADHVNLIRRYASRALVVFDPDEAGKKALMRSLSLFLKGNVEMKAVVLPAGYDPDTFIRHFGIEGWQEEITRARPAVEYYIDEVMGSAHGIQEERTILRKALDFIRDIPSAAERHLFIRRIAQRLNMDEDILEREVAMSTPNTKAPDRAPLQDSGEKGAEITELKLIYFMLKDGEYVKRIAQSDTLDFFIHENMKQLASTIRDRHGQGEPIDPISVTAELGASERNRILSWMMNKGLPKNEMEREFIDTIRRLKEKWYSMTCKDINMQIRQAQERGDEAMCRSLLAQKGKLLKQAQTIRNLTVS